MNWPLIILILRLVAMGLSFMIMILTAYVAHWYNFETLTNSPPQVNFMIVTSVFTIFIMAYLEGSVRFMPRFYFPIVAIVLHGIYGLFYFSGMIAMAVFLRNLLFCRGTVCTAAQSATGLAGLQVAVFVGLSVILGLNWQKLVRKPARSGLRGPKAGAYPTDMKERELSDA